jgi:hypothetical protein
VLSGMRAVPAVEYAATNEVVTKLSWKDARGSTGCLLQPLEILASDHCETTLFYAWASDSAVLAAPSTFVMRLRLYAIVAKPISTFASERPRIKRRGCPKILYLIVAKGCSTVDRRSLIASGPTLSCMRFKASSYRCRADLTPPIRPVRNTIWTKGKGDDEEQAQ